VACDSEERLGLRMKILRTDAEFKRVTCIESDVEFSCSVIESTVKR
jgi:hypothetical protein